MTITKEWASRLTARINLLRSLRDYYYRGYVVARHEANLRRMDELRELYMLLDHIVPFFEVLLEYLTAPKPTPLRTKKRPSL
jgi:hypothetical protein